MTEELFRGAFWCDVRPLLREWRRARGLPEDPLAALAESGYGQPLRPREKVRLADMARGHIELEGWRSIHAKPLGHPGQSIGAHLETEVGEDRVAGVRVRVLNSLGRPAGDLVVAVDLEAEHVDLLGAGCRRFGVDDAG